jgi:hypothetical protein
MGSREADSKACTIPQQVAVLRSRPAGAASAAVPAARAQIAVDCEAACWLCLFVLLCAWPPTCHPIHRGPLAVPTQASRQSRHLSPALWFTPPRPALIIASNGALPAWLSAVSPLPLSILVSTQYHARAPPGPRRRNHPRRHHRAGAPLSSPRVVAHQHARARAARRHRVKHPSRIRPESAPACDMVALSG